MEIWRGRNAGALVTNTAKGVFLRSPGRKRGLWNNNTPILICPEISDRMSLVHMHRKDDLLSYGTLHRLWRRRDPQTTGSRFSTVATRLHDPARQKFKIPNQLLPLRIIIQVQSLYNISRCSPHIASIMSGTLRRLYSSAPSSSASSVAAQFLSKTQSLPPQTQTQFLDANQLQRFSATLSRTELSEALPAKGTPLPACYHLAYFTPFHLGV